MKNPNHYDANKLLQQRIYEYLAKTHMSGLLCIYPEAKQSTHSSLGGCKLLAMQSIPTVALILVVFLSVLEDNEYFRSSSVQRLVSSDSSTYAELIAPHDGAHTIQWLSFLMEELGYSVSGD